MFCENGKKSLAFSLPRNGLHRLRLRDIKSWSWWRGCFQIDRADVAGAALSRTLGRESDNSRAPTGSSFPFPSPFDRAHLHGESHREIQSPATSRKTFLLSLRWLSKKVYSKIILSALIVRSLYIEITCLSNTRLRIFFFWSCDILEHKVAQFSFLIYSLFVILGRLVARAVKRSSLNVFDLFLGKCSHITLVKNWHHCPSEVYGYGDN